MKPDLTKLKQLKMDEIDQIKRIRELEAEIEMLKDLIQRRERRGNNIRKTSLHIVGRTVAGTSLYNALHTLVGKLSKGEKPSSEEMTTFLFSLLRRWIRVSLFALTIVMLPILINAASLFAIRQQNEILRSEIKQKDAKERNASLASAHLQFEDLTVYFYEILKSPLTFSLEDKKIIGRRMDIEKQRFTDNICLAVFYPEFSWRFSSILYDIRSLVEDSHPSTPENDEERRMTAESIIDQLQAMNILVVEEIGAMESQEDPNSSTHKTMFER